MHSKANINVNTNIYVLKLNNDCYYVGKSGNVEKRYNDHLEGKGSVWTKLHHPISIDKIIEDASIFDEDKITKEYMATYGIDNVRGGSYVTISLSKEIIKILEKEISMALDKCLKCGQVGHFAKYCNTKKVCAGCGKYGHTVSRCYAKTTLSGNKILKCNICGRTGHISSKCYAKTTLAGDKILKCNICGKVGHITTECHDKLPKLPEIENDILHENISHEETRLSSGVNSRTTTNLNKEEGASDCIIS